MKLVDLTGAAKWFSMHAMGWPAAAIFAWVAIPDKWQDYVLAHTPTWVLLTIIGIVLVLGMIGRVVDQKKAAE